MTIPAIRSTAACSIVPPARRPQALCARTPLGTRWCAGLLAALSLSAAPLYAQQPAEPDSVPAYILDAVTVEARRAPAERSTLPQQVDVVTRTDLERTPAGDLAGALKRTTPIDVIEYPALLSGVSVRGFRPQFSGLNPRTLILVDGRPAGATNLATLRVGEVERIEVLKGPASALYGSGAMGGAINVVTRRTEGPLTGHLSTGFGSFGSYGGELTAGGDLGGGFDFDLGLSTHGRRSGFHTGGNRLLGGESVTKYFADGSTGDLAEVVRDTLLEHAEFSTRSASLRAGYRLAPTWRLDARVTRFAGDDIENPGDLNVSAYSTRTLNDLDRTSSDLSLTGEAGIHTLRLRGFTAREVTSYYDDPEAPAFISSRSPNRWIGGQVQDVIALGSHSVTAGVDYLSSRSRSEVFSAPGTPTSPYNADAAIGSLAGFAEGRLELLGGERLVATLGGRLDRVTFRIDDAQLLDGSRVQGDSETHAVFNPSGGLVFRPGGGLRLHASGGRSFVTPGAFNVAGYSEAPAGERSVVVTRGNPALDPETGTSWDLGIGFRSAPGGVDVDLTYFSTNVNGRVAAVPVAFEDVRLTPGGDTIRAITTYRNADEARIRGLEVSASHDFGARLGFPYSLRVFAAATRMLAAEETAGGKTTDIRNVADLTVVGGVEYDDLRRFTVRLAGRYVGERLDSDFTDFMNPGDVRYPEFVVFDLSGGLRLGERYRITGELANLADENYYEVRGYTMPGRHFRLGVGMAW